ncbi:hypothetical protein [Salinarimonas ramus]|uniref:Uncharacterized protein n=1 Tax=Salinarimonas ramus TaxID=690164 RepID=A0A917Q4L8_9HYPH|nr:hypothetical protein [Salinarimonas ramus]GGK22360.1 hypothetical protein GCM10011322_06280 [Salinarimonas ramus]
MSFADFGKRPGWAAEQRRKSAEERQRILQETNATIARMRGAGTAPSRPEEDPAAAMLRIRRETNAAIRAINERTLEVQRGSREKQFRLWRQSVLGYWD